MNAQSSDTIAVFGGTGKQGGAVIDSLLSRGAQVRALVRSPESDRARALADRGVELARIEIDDAGSLSAALQGVDAFFLMTTPETDTAAAFGEHAGLPARYEALPLQVLGDSEDTQAMFRWFAETPAHQADITALQAIEPGAWDLPAWLRFSGWTLPIPGR